MEARRPELLEALNALYEAPQRAERATLAAGTPAASGPAVHAEPSA
jgi:hypothetical protein